LGNTRSRAASVAATTTPTAAIAADTTSGSADPLKPNANRVVVAAGMDESEDQEPATKRKRE
jgi:uncharacterized protein YfiM (DUF2279 family)